MNIRYFSASDWVQKAFVWLSTGRFLVIFLPYIWALFFFLIPFLFVLKISFSELTIGVPPYTPIVEWINSQTVALKLNLGNYTYLFYDDLYVRAYLNSLGLAALATLGCLLIGYPMAYVIVKAPTKYQPLFLLLIILPFWTSFLIRVYAWMGILSHNGVINLFLIKLGIIQEPLQLLNRDFSVVLGILYCYLPFMILPLYVTLQKIDSSLLEAAYDLGCRPFRAFWYVIIPLTIPGIISGCLLVFIPAVGEFVIPELLGGADTLMIGRVLWNEFFVNRDWPVAAVVAIALLIFLIFPIFLLQKLQRDIHEGRK